VQLTAHYEQGRLIALWSRNMRYVPAMAGFSPIFKGGVTARIAQIWLLQLPPLLSPKQNLT
jgi:hypothetical protein